MTGRAIERLDGLLAVLVFAGMTLALYMALIGAPTERTMGDIQRIFYFHVPAAVTGFTAFAVNFAASLLYLARRRPGWDALALASAEVGILLFGMVLVTGPIWAKPVWFVWWTWSPRLTTSFILVLLYAAYLVVRKSFEDPDRRAKVAAVFGVVAFLDAPLVWFSIRWWRDIHPSPMLESGGIDPAMRPAFWACLAAFELLLVYLLRRRYALESLEEELERLGRLAE